MGEAKGSNLRHFLVVGDHVNNNKNNSKGSGIVNEM